MSLIFQALTNIVDVYVRHLRGKIDDGHARRRGVGCSISDAAET
jgi:DNA-binding response OmpR family regulator